MNLKPLLDKLPEPLRRRPVLAAAGALVLLMLLVLGRMLVSGDREAPTGFYQVRRGDFTVSIVEGGTLAAVKDVSVRNEVEGTARIIFIAKEGTYVKKGDLLVELDSSQAQDQINQQQINFEKAKFALEQAKQQLEIQRSLEDSNIRASKLKLRFADLELDKFERGSSVVELIEATNKLVQAEAQLAVNQQTYDYTTNLASKGYETKQREDSDRLALLNTKNQLIVASNSIWITKAFDHLKKREQYASDVAEAKQELARVTASAERRIAQYEADLITQSNTLVLNERKLERDRKNLDSTKITAPQDGLVVYPVSENRFSSESLIEEGAVVRNRQELIKLPDTARMKVTVRVHESHVNMIRPGLPAFVKLDSLPDEQFAGVVDKVGLLPDTQSRFGNPNLKVYNTDVLITGALPDVKPGVSARAEIIITNLSNTLYVPIQAVTTLKGRQVCYLANGAKPTPVPVTVGMFNTRFIEIISGLSEGQRVLLAPPFDSQEKDLEGSVLSAEEKAKVVVSNVPPRRASAPAATPGGDAAAPAVAGPAGGRPDRATEDPGAARPDSGRRGGGPPSEEMLKQFDKDGDGQLSDEERQAMRDAMRQRSGRGQGGGGFGGGQMPEAMLKQFDKNGDGELDESERAAMREQFGRGRNRTNAPARSEQP